MLSALLGYQDQQNFEVVEATQQVTPPTLDVQPLITQALQQRPEVAALQFQVESAQKNSNAEHDLWRPTISALGTAGIAPVRDPQIHNWYGAVGVNINGRRQPTFIWVQNHTHTLGFSPVEIEC